MATTNFTTTVKDFYNKYDATVEFEQLFMKRTSNKWSDRAYFQQKPGMYLLIRKESEKEIVVKFSGLEKEILKLIKDRSEVGAPVLVKNEETAAVVRSAWDI